MKQKGFCLYIVCNIKRRDKTITTRNMFLFCLPLNNSRETSQPSGQACIANLKVFFFVSICSKCSFSSAPFFCTFFILFQHLSFFFLLLVFSHSKKENEMRNCFREAFTSNLITPIIKAHKLILGSFFIHTFSSSFPL